MVLPSVVLALVATLATALVPGLALLAPLRLRPLAATALAAPVSIAVLTVAAELGAMLGAPWSVLGPLLPLLSAAALVPLLLRRVRAGRAARQPPLSSRRRIRPR